MIKGLKYERAEPGEVDESAGWHVPGRKIEHFEGIIGKVKIHPEKRTLFEEKATSFCSTVRAIATLLIKDKPPGKPTLMKRFSLSGREYNLALSRATGMIESAKTLTANRKETIDGNISSLKEKIEETGTDIADLTELQKSLYKQRRNKKVTIKKKAEITKRLERNYITLYKSRQKRCFLKARLIRAERKLADIPKQPHIFMFGKAAYHNQPDYKKITPDGRTAWRSEWQNARNSMFGARGSSDEVGGNSTYRIVFSGVSIKVGNYLGRLTPSTAYNFSICHGKHGIIGKFTLSEKEGRVLQNILIKNNAPIKKTMTEGKIKKGVSVMRADISERTPLKVEFCRQGDNWNIHVTYPQDSLQMNPIIRGAIGIDTNHGHFESCEVLFYGNKFTLGEYRQNRYDVDAPSMEKKAAISAHIRELVFSAREKSCAIVMENLDWEGGQKSRTKLGATLSAMPYRSILFKVMRECARMGVPFRLVNARHTSLLGNVLSTHNCKLSRDVASSAIIAMRGLSPREMDNHIKTILSESNGIIRLNEKRRFGRHVTVPFIKPGQLDTGSVNGTESTSLQNGKGGSFSRHVGDAISKVARSVRCVRYAAPGRISCRPSDKTGKPNPLRYQAVLARNRIITPEKSQHIPSLKRVHNFEPV